MLTQSLLKKAFYDVTVAVLAAGATSLIAIGHTYRLAQSELARTTNLKSLDVANAVAHADWAHVRELADVFMVKHAAHVRLQLAQHHIYDLPSTHATSACTMPIKSTITHYGVSLGTVTVCLSLRDIILASLTNPWIVPPAIIITMLIATVSAIPLASKWQRDLRAEKQKARTSALEAAVELTAQVAHDIRSPLAALKMLEKKLEHVSDEQRMLTRNAIARITQIANQMLERCKAGLSHDEARSVDPSKAVEALLAEQRIKYADKPALSFNFVRPTDNEAAVHVEPLAFDRMLTNLINNAAEACKHAGTTTVELQTGSKITLSVRDTGVGIPPDALSKLGRRGVTFNKKGGSGFGLYHAQTCARSWGGSLNIASKVGIGTTVTICLPAAQVA